MSRQLATNPLVWQNRWHEPTVQDLLTPLKSHHRRVFEKIQEQLSDLQPLREAIVWYGTGWNWTIEYHPQSTNGKGRATRARNGHGNGHANGHGQALCYLVPRIENPLVCVPLSDPAIEQLPLRRLSKLIRDGIKAAKYAVETHWATWSPNNQSEAEQLIDLIRRKHKLDAEQSAKKH
jgi:hypothetical protein